MKKKMIKILHTVIFGVFVLPLTLQAEDMPDYYEEAGIPAARQLLNQNANELIDPFSGTLNLQHVDTEIPGNGGLDIIIQRSYANLHDVQPDPLGLRTPYGVGWSMHFGRVLKSAGSDVCTNDPVNSSDNPTLGLPDGSQQLLFDAVNQGVAETYTYITKQRWKADCQSYGTHNGLAVWSPEGLKYDMAWLNNAGTALYVTKITDRNGNYINISYENSAAGYTLINSVTSSDNRTVTYSYTARTSNSVRLNTITANSQTWTYRYSAVSGVGTEHYNLDTVVRPDGTTWQYSYNTESGAGEYSIKKITYPTTGYVEYIYGYTPFGPVGDSRQTTSVTKKITSDNGIWLYKYTPGSAFDKTEISTPNGDIEYQHYGARAADNDGINSLWKVGVLLKKSIGDIQVETYAWSGQRISDENYFRPKRILSNAFDTEIYVPILTKKISNKDGTDYTTTFPFANYDKYGNAGKVVETGNASVTRTNTYYINTAKWILHELNDETLSGLTGNSTISRTYDANGNVKSVNRYGATTNYTYTNTSASKGDIATITDPAAKRITYSNYKNGVAGSESQLEGVSIIRDVNETGTIASVRNGESKLTTYGYDSLNRIDSVQRPINSIVSIDYSANKRTLTRFTYSEITDYDGFGRPVKVTKIGGDTSVVNINYNALGQKLFESYPNSSVGISYSYDNLGRIKTTAYSGGGVSTYTYKLGNKVTIKNQKGNSTTYTYRSFGDPEEKELMKIQSPESITTTITRNNLGQLSTVTQGGKTRTYSYYPTHFLKSIDDPETNKTTYGRDNVGNMTTRKVGTSGTTNFTYDGLHRLKTVNYPGATTPDVTYTYDKNSNLETAGTSAATRTYTYDSNDNLRTERLSIGAQNYSLTYSLSLLDHVTSIIYPSGRVVTYSTDPKGRQTEVAPFITDITYYPNGQPNTLQYANGVLTQLGQNSRQWMSSIVTPITNGNINLSYSYDNNGNIKEITNNADNSYTRKMTYDTVDRLATASGIWGAGTINYEIGGNIKTMNIGGRNIAYTYDPSNNKLLSTSGGINHTFAYDVYGNVSGNGTDNFTFNDAADLVKVKRNSNDIADFQYDGNQSMVTKTEGGQTVHLLYNKSGNLMGEYTPTGQWLKENAYLDSKLIAVVKNQAVIPPSLNVPSVDYDGGYTVSWVPSNTTTTQYELLESTSSDFTKAVLIYQGPGLSKAFTGKGNGEYYYWVRACVGVPVTCGIYSTGTNSISVELPPGIPSGITVPTLDTDGSYNISWGSASGTLTHYELYEATDSVFSDQTLAAYTSSLSQVLSDRGSNRYYYRIRACYKTGCSDYRVGLNRIDVNIPIGIPSSITVPASDQDGVYDISWGTTAGGPTYYEVYEANNALYSGESLVAQVAATTATITGKLDGTYYYRVRGCSPFVCGGFVEEPLGVNVNILPPTPPDYLTVPTVNYSGTYSINWNSGDGEIIRYELYESTNASFAGEAMVFQGLGYAFGFTGKATSNATYYYRIRACSAVVCSNFTTGSNGVSVKIAPGMPGAITWPATDDDGRYTLSWGAASGTVTHYELEEDTSKTFPSPLRYKPSGPSVDIVGKSNGSYLYKVQACNGFACSDFTDSTGFVTVTIPTDKPSYINVPSADYSGIYTVDWGAATGISFNRYELYEATVSNFSDAQLIYNGTNRSTDITKQMDGSYFYRVRGCIDYPAFFTSYCSDYRTGENNVKETIISTRAALLSIITNLLLN
ncbi:MAG: RHS repeat protein [Ectothiorhodospiraceae bacterium]|nr:RHS repeat protein [Ectothiorhodospiraceae bacterium]